jgi:ABC-type antimicrobial peptide transport system permease subunit
MGNFRVFTRSVKFTTRTKRRFIVFLLIFALTATFIAFFVNQFDQYQTNDYLDQRGVLLRQLQDYSVTGTEGKNLIDDIVEHNFDFDLDILFQYQYVDLDNSLRLYSFDINNPWLHRVLNPAFVISGSFPSSTNELLITHGDVQLRNSTNGVLIESSVAVGSVFNFINEDDSYEVSISGTIDSVGFSAKSDSRMLWMFAAQQTFEEILDFYGLDLFEDTFTHSIAITVSIEGTGIPLLDIPNEIDYANVEDLGRELQLNFIPNTVEYGEFQNEVVFSTVSVKNDSRISDLIGLLFAVIGGIMMITIFSYLLSKFRKREIAILKAMGYSSTSIRLSLTAEIVAIAFLGFVFGTGSAQGLLFYNSGFKRSILLRPQALIISFLIVVLVTLPGMFIATSRALNVSPMEVFRDK